MRLETIKASKFYAKGKISGKVRLVTVEVKPKKEVKHGKV